MPEVFGSWESLVKPIEPLAFLALRAIVVYTVLLAMFRWLGKREIGQMTPFDLVLILLIANAVQNSMIGTDTSLVSGLISAVVLFALNHWLARLQARHAFFRRLLVGEPVLLIHNGRVIAEALRRHNMTESDIVEKMQEHGISRLEDIAEAILEPDGNLSFFARVGDSVDVRLRDRNSAIETAPSRGSGGTT